MQPFVSLIHPAPLPFFSCELADHTGSCVVGVSVDESSERSLSLLRCSVSMLSLRACLPRSSSICMFLSARSWRNSFLKMSTTNTIADAAEASTHSRHTNAPSIFLHRSTRREATRGGKQGSGGRGRNAAEMQVSDVVLAANRVVVVVVVVRFVNKKRCMLGVLRIQHGQHRTLE